MGLKQVGSDEKKIPGQAGNDGKANVVAAQGGIYGEDKIEFSVNTKERKQKKDSRSSRE